MAGPVLSVRVHAGGGTASVMGELARQGVPMFLEEVGRLVTSDVTVDLSQVTYIDEEGVAALITAQRVLLGGSRSFTIRNPSIAVQHQLAVRGLLDFLNVERKIERSASHQINRLVGVYDVNGYNGRLILRARVRLLRSRCALRDITHGAICERREWTLLRSTIPVAFDTCHRDHQTGAIRQATEGITPAVVAETADFVVALLGPAEVIACDRSPTALVAAIDAQVEALDLCWPNP